MDLDLDASGFYGLLERTEIETSTRKLLPHTCDLFEEARFFIQLLASLEQCVSNLAAANWCVGAHFGAYITINGAARYDIENLGHKYDGTGLQKEFYLTSNNPDRKSRDPFAINRLYGDLRNIRDHFGQSLVELKTTMQLPDLAEERRAASPRWYLRPLQTLKLDRLKTRLVSEFELHKFSEFYEGTVLLKLLCQNLLVMATAINKVKPQQL
jgi:hypothetical protein